MPGVERLVAHFPAATENRQFHVEKALIGVGSIPAALSLVLADKSIVWLWDRSDMRFARKYEVAVPGRMLSTLNMWTRSVFYDNDLGCIIFGFSRDARYVPPHIQEQLYIAALNEPNPGQGAAPQHISAELQTRRAAYWNMLGNSLANAAH